MFRRCLPALTCVVFVSLLAPLGFADDEPAKPEGDAKPAEKAVEITVIPALKLLEAGAEPRQKLRYAPTPGSATEVESAVTTNVTSMMGEMKVGPIKQTVKIGFEKGSADGRYTLSAEYTASTLVDDGTNPMASMLKAGIDSQKGEKLSGEINDRGIWTADPLKGAGTDAQQGLRAQLLGMLPPLPQEAVGLGAKWTVTVKLTVANIVQTSVGTLEITKLDGKRVELSLQEKRSAKDTMVKYGPQEIPIKTLEGSITGKLTIDLALGATIRFEAKGETKTVMNFQGQEMPNSAKMEQTMSGKAAAAVTAKKE